MARDHQPIGADANRQLLKEEAIRLRVTGYSYAQIAEKMGLAKATVYRYVADVLEESRENAADMADQAREIELRRIDEASKLCMQTLVEEKWDDEIGGTEERPGDPTKGRELRLKAIDRLVKLNEQRAKLLGLYAPTEVKQTFSGEATPAEIQSAVAARFGSAAAVEQKEHSGDSPDEG